jgi:hypothetical protein
MRLTNLNSEERIEQELLFLYKRIEANAKNFGMSEEEVATIKQKCALAYRHKLIFDKARKRRSE